MNTPTPPSRTQVLGLFLAAVVAASVMVSFAGLTAAATTTDLTVSITDDDNTIAIGETTTVEIAVATADSGVGAAELGVELSDPGVAAITDVSVLHNAGNEDNNIAGGGQSADVKYAFANSPDTGSVTILEVTLQAAAEGQTTVNVVQNSQTGNLVMFDKNGEGYTLGNVGSATLTVEEVNQDPVADAGDDQTVQAGDTVTLDGSGSMDPNPDDTLSFSWTQTGGPSVSLSDASAEQPTFTAPDVSSETTLDFQLEVTDDDGASDTDTVSVTVQPTAPANQPPTAEFTTSPSTPEVGDTVTFDAGPSTDDGNIVSYDWTIETAGTSGPSSLLSTDFESGSLSAAGWSHDAIESSASAGVSDATSNSGTQSAFHNGGEGALVSPVMDASGAQSVTVEYWVQKGAESFSEDPDANSGEDLVVEYLDSNGNWVEFDRYEDTLPAGAESTDSVTLSDSGALHDGLQIRFRQQGASTANGDYWHVDDVSVEAQAGTGGGTTTKTGETVTHTFSQPGTYDVTLTVTDGDGASDTDTAQVTVEDAAEPAPGKPTTVILSPSNGQTVVDGTQTFDVVVESAQGGVGAGEIRVAVDDTAIAAITDADVAGVSGDNEVTQVDSGGAWVDIEYFGADTDNVGAVTVATVTVEGASEGTTGLSLAPSDGNGEILLFDEAGNGYDVTDTTGATLDVLAVQFLVDSTSAPEKAAVGSTVTVTATVSSDGAVESTQPVELLLDVDGDGTMESMETKQVTVDANGQTQVSFDVLVPAGASFGDREYSVETLGNSAGGTVEFTPPDINGDGNLPGDLNNDGIYEDVNGDGSLNTGDAQALFGNRDATAVQNNPDAFDFNGDGVVNVGDAQALFNMASGS